MPRNLNNEIYHTSSGSPVVLKWSVMLNGKRHIKINGDKINVSNNYDVFETQYNICETAWNNKGNGLVSVVHSSFSSSNVDVAMPTSNYWQQTMQGDRYYDLGHCLLSDTNDNEIDSLATALNSTRNINYAAIFLNPDDDFFKYRNSNELNTTLIKYTIVHEVGHALTLGHPNGEYNTMYVDSVMNTDVVAESLSYYLPQVHDNNDLIAKYG